MLGELQGRFRNMPQVKSKEIVFEEGLDGKGEEQQGEEEKEKPVEINFLGEAASFGDVNGGLFAALQSKVESSKQENRAIILD